MFKGLRGTIRRKSKLLVGARYHFSTISLTSTVLPHLLDTAFSTPRNLWKEERTDNGNEGPSCTTVSSLGDYAKDVAVGSTDQTNGFASFISKGPSASGLLNREVLTLGYNVCLCTSDSAYNNTPRMSMATPHGSGVIALVLTANPHLQLGQVHRHHAGGNGNIQGGTLHNNNFGYGPPSDVKAMANGSTPTLASTSVLTSASTGTPRSRQL